VLGASPVAAVVYNSTTMKVMIATLTNATVPTCGGAGTFQLTLGLVPRLLDTTLLTALPTSASYFTVANMQKLVGNVAQAPLATDTANIFTTLATDMVMSFVCSSDYSTGSPNIIVQSLTEGSVGPIVLSGGAIAGIVIGSVVFVVLVIVLIWLCVRKKGPTTSTGCCKKKVKKTGESLPLHDNKVLVTTGK
jgi:hypothetical protein